ncbi:MAG TPA: hypothetical protein EYP19_05260 [Desulfobacterales bacterium]|nr:hypothetical protein [Desulfobacterales bacterium]
MYAEMRCLATYFTRRADICHYGLVPSRSPRVLALSDDILCYEASGVLFGFDISRGRLLWPLIDKSGRLPKANKYTVRRGPQGRPRIYKWSGGLAEIDPRTDKENELAPVGPNHATGFAFGPQGEVFTAEDRYVSCYSTRSLKWRRDAGEKVVLGPVLSKDKIVAGTRDGRVLALHMNTGRTTLVSRGPFRFFHECTSTGGKVIFFDKEDETLVAVASSVGKAAWRFPVGDLPLNLHLLDNARILLAAKNNWIVLLDSVSGRVIGRRRWHTWPLAVLPVGKGAGPCIVVVDLESEVSFLDIRTLKTISKIEAFADLQGTAIFVPDLMLKRLEAFPEPGCTLPLVELDPEPSVVVTDSEGFFYVLRVHAEQ